MRFRYLIFVYATFSPNGGMSDLQGMCADLEQAHKTLNEKIETLKLIHGLVQAEIFDCERMEVIFEL